MLNFVLSLIGLKKTIDSIWSHVTYINNVDMSVKAGGRFLPLSGMTHGGVPREWVPTGCAVEVHTLTVIAQCWQLFDGGWKGWLVQGTKLASETLRSAWVSRDVPNRIWTLSLDVVAFGNAVCDMLNLCSDPNVIFISLCHSPLMFYSESSPSACSLSAFFFTYIFKMSFCSERLSRDCYQ